MQREPNSIPVKRSNQLALQICGVPEEKHQPLVSRSITCGFKLFYLRSYGSSEVKILAAHYDSTQTDNYKEKLHAEWNNFKFELVEWKLKEEFKTATTTTTTPTDWVLHHLITMKDPTHKCIPCSTKSLKFAPRCQYPMLGQREE